MELLDRQKTEVTFPFIQLGVIQQGITVTIHHGPMHSETILLPAENADAITGAWLATRPKEVFKQVLQIRQESQAHSAMMNHAVQETMRRA